MNQGEEDFKLALGRGLLCSADWRDLGSGSVDWILCPCPESDWVNLGRGWNGLRPSPEIGNSGNRIVEYRVFVFAFGLVDDAKAGEAKCEFPL